jgi:hypothetical protein
MFKERDIGIHVLQKEEYQWIRLKGAQRMDTRGKDLALRRGAARQRLLLPLATLV